jgi:hypothetical protein
MGPSLGGQRDSSFVPWGSGLIKALVTATSAVLNGGKTLCGVPNPQGVFAFKRIFSGLVEMERELSRMVRILTDWFNKSASP